jgi:acyl carrier protein
MAVTGAQVLRIIYDCLDELNEQLMPEQQLAKGPDVALFGPSADLDSLGFVNLIALLEERCESHLGISVSLSDELAKESTNQVHTVANLANCIAYLLVKKQTEAEA